VGPRAVRHHERGAGRGGGVAVRGGTGAEAAAVRVADGPVGLGPPLLLPVPRQRQSWTGWPSPAPSPGSSRHIPGPVLIGAYPACGRAATADRAGGPASPDPAATAAAT